MSTYYKKLYTKTITLPFIKYEGISSAENSDYYAVLEKNYVPVASTETWDTSTGDWVTVKLTPENTKYNRLSIETCQRNDGATPRTRIFEFKANVPVTPSDGIMIDPCNSIFAVIRQEPKQVLEAKIELIPFEETDQTLNDAGNELTINGDDQIVKIIYYGVNNTAKVLNNTELKIDGNAITEYSPNVVSLEKTGYGNVLIYKIPQYKGVGNKTINLECIYHGNYDRTETATATIKQVPNVYGEFKLGIGNLDTKSATVQNSDTSLQIYCQLYKNDVLVTSGIKLQFSEGSTGKPYIITKAYTTEVYADHVKFTVPIDKNITPEKRYITVSAEYKTETSNTVTAEQNSASVNIKAFRGTNLITGNISITGNKQTQEIKYYAEATLQDSNIVQYISYENKLSTGIQKVSLKSEVKTNCTIDFDTSYNKQNYKITTVSIDENISETNKTSEVYLKFDNDSKTTTVTFVQTAILIVITDAGSTTEFNGLAEFNQVKLKFTINEDSSYVTPLASINVVVPSDFELYNTIVEGNTIIYVYNITEDYGITEFNSNDEAENRDRMCTVSYKSASKTFTITQHPVYFGVKISREPTGKVTGTPGNKVEVYGEGIIYNSSTDKVNFITVPSNGITLSDDSYITIDNEPTDLQYISILTFDKNDTGSSRTVTVTTVYKGLTASLTIEQNSVLITLNMAFLIDDKEVSGISQYIKNPWDETSTVDFIAYITGYVNGEYVIITDVNEGTLTVENGSSLSTYFSIDNINCTTEKVSFENGIIRYRFTMQRTYLGKNGSLKFKYSVTHGSSTRSKYLRVYIPSVRTENEAGKYFVEPNDEFAKFEYDETVSATNGTGRLQTYVKYVSYMSSKIYGVQEDPTDEEVGIFTLTCDGATYINPTITADGYKTFDLTFPDNSTTEEKLYDFTLTYTNKDYEGTAKEYNRTITKTGTFKQSSGDIELLLSFNSAAKVTSYEIDGLPHDDVYIYVQLKINGVIRTDISNDDISFESGLNRTYDSLDFLNINGNVYVYKVKDITFNNSNTNIETTYKCNYAGTYSNEITLKQKSLLNDSNASVEVTVSPETVPNSGANTSATFTYCFKYNGTAVDIGNNWEITKKNQDDTDVNVTNESETGAERSCVYTFGENTDTDKSKSVTLTATAFGKTGSATATQGLATYDVYINVSKTTIGPESDTFDLTYYGTLNGKNVTDGVSLAVNTTPSWWERPSTITPTSNNTYIETWTIGNNNTEDEQEVTFTVSYKSKTKTATVKQLSNTFQCILEDRGSNDGEVNAVGEENRIFAFYGIKSGKNVTDNNVQFYCDKGSVSIGEPSVVGSGDIAEKQVKVTFPLNDSASVKEYIFRAAYDYGGGIKEAIIKLQQQVGNYTVYIEASKETLAAADGGTLIIKYWADTPTGNNRVYDPNLIQLTYEKIGELSNIVSLTLVKTEKDDVNKVINATFTYSSNTGEGGDTEKGTKFTATYLIFNNSIDVKQLGGNQTVLSPFDYVIFEYILDNGPNAPSNTWSSDITLDQWNELAGQDLDTKIIITANDDKDISMQNDNGTQFNLNKLTAGFGQTINNPDKILDNPKHSGYNSFIQFSGDNTSATGLESVYVNMRKITNTDLLSKGIHTLYINLYGHWYNNRYRGNIRVTYRTYNQTTSDWTTGSHLSLDNFSFTTDEPYINEVILDDSQQVYVYDDIGGSKYTLMAVLEYNVKTGNGVLSLKNEPSNINDIKGKVTGAQKFRFQSMNNNIVTISSTIKSDKIGEQYNIKLYPIYYQSFDKDNKILSPFSEYTEPVYSIADNGGIVCNIVGNNLTFTVPTFTTDESRTIQLNVDSNFPGYINDGFHKLNIKVDFEIKT